MILCHASLIAGFLCNGSWQVSTSRGRHGTVKQSKEILSASLADHIIPVETQLKGTIKQHNFFGHYRVAIAPIFSRGVPTSPSVVSYLRFRLSWSIWSKMLLMTHLSELLWKSNRCWNWLTRGLVSSFSNVLLCTMIPLSNLERSWRLTRCRTKAERHSTRCLEPCMLSIRPMSVNQRTCVKGGRTLAGKARHGIWVDRSRWLTMRVMSTATLFSN